MSLRGRGAGFPGTEGGVVGPVVGSLPACLQGAVDLGRGDRQQRGGIRPVQRELVHQHGHGVGQLVGCVVRALGRGGPADGIGHLLGELDVVHDLASLDAPAEPRRQRLENPGPGALVLSLKAGGTGLNLTGANHVVLYDRWWNPAVEDQARDRAWRIGQTRTVVSHRLVCPGTVDERVEEVVAGKRHIADLVLPKSSTLADLDGDQLRIALGLRSDTLVAEEASQ